MLSPGDAFDRYRIDALLGEGGMGRVYLAYDTRLARKVALKVLHARAVGADGTDGAARLVREARVAAALDHPNLVAVFDVGEADGVPYLVMEYLEGRSLRAHVGDAAVPVATRVRWLLDVARALGAAHAKGLVHRDIKPENVMIKADGAVKVLDFGIARRTQGVDALAQTIDPLGHTAVEGGTIPTLTGEGVLIGTPLYMAPEQMLSRPLDGRADQFAWGVMAFELLTGSVPWGDARTAVSLIAEVVSERRAPAIVAADVPEPVRAVVARALEKGADARFPTMEALVAALGPTSLPPSAAVSAESPMPDAPGAPVVPGRGRWRAAIGSVAVAAVLGLGLGWGAKASRAPGTVVGAPSASASAGVAQGKVIRFIDLPPPATDNPEALAAYQQGMRNLHDNAGAAVTSFVKAVKLDPTFAAAHLRLACWGGRPFSTTAYREALRFAGKLDARDRALLDAEQPYEVPAVPDYAEADRRLEALHRERPLDVEILYWLARLRAERDVESSIPTAEELVRLDPTNATAEARLGNLLVDLERPDEARGHLRRCVELSPLSPSCHLALGIVEARGGHCEVFAEAAKSVNVFAADDLLTPFDLLSAAMTSGVPRSGAEAVVAAMRVHPAMAGPDWAAMVDQLEGEIALWYGAMDEATVAFDRVGVSSSAGSVVGQFSQELGAVEEAGDEKRVASLLRDYVAGRAMKQGELPEDAIRLCALREHHVLSEREVARLRDQWRKEASPDLSATPWLRWLAFDAVPALSPDEAREALALPSALPVPHARQTHVNAQLGHVLLLAGRAAEASRYLEEAAYACRTLYGFSTFSSEVPIIRAAFDLGQAREALGDKAAACAAYSRVLARWGHATPRSITAEKARTRSTALRCTE